MHTLKRNFCSLCWPIHIDKSWADVLDIRKSKGRIKRLWMDLENKIIFISIYTITGTTKLISREIWLRNKIIIFSHFGTGQLLNTMWKINQKDLHLRFYVKSMSSMNSENLTSYHLGRLDAWIFTLQIFAYLKVKISPNGNLELLNRNKMAVFWASKMPKLISRKIWIAEFFSYFHTGWKKQEFHFHLQNISWKQFIQ